MLSETEYLYCVIGDPNLRNTFTLVGTSGLDRVLVAQLNRGILDTDKAFVIPIRGKVDIDLDSIFNGLNYGRTKQAGLTPDGFVALDAVIDGVNYRKVRSAALTAGGLVLLDALVEGTYGRVRKTALTAEGLVLLDTLATGGVYGLVNKVDIQAGHIILSSVVQSATHQTVNNQEKIGAVDSYNFFENKITAYGVSIYSSASGTRTELTAGGIKGWRDNSLQFEIRSSDGRAYAGAGAVVLDNVGITIYGAYLNFEGNWNVWVPQNQVPLGVGSRRPFFPNTPGGVWSAAMWISHTGYFGVMASGNNGTIYWSTRDINGQLVDNFLVPYESGHGYLGATNLKWKGVYATEGWFDVMDFGTIGGNTVILNSLQTNFNDSGNIGNPGFSFNRAHVMDIYLGRNIQPDVDNWSNLGTPSRYLAAVRTYQDLVYDVIYTNIRGAASPNAGIFPWIPGTGYCGSPSRYWERMYASDVAYRNLYTFQGRDDLALVKKLHSRRRRIREFDPEQRVRGVMLQRTRNAEIEVMDPDDAPEELREDGFYKAGAVQGLTVSALAQLIGQYEATVGLLEVARNRIQAHTQRLVTNEAEIADLKAQLLTLKETMDAHTGDEERHQGGPGG
jgi:hypothetical protein